MTKGLRIALRPLRELAPRLEQVTSFDRVSEALATVVEHACPDGSPVNEVLSGTDLDHPLHPLLTDVGIGAWTGAVAMDWFGGRGGGPAADRRVRLGLWAAGPAAVSGLSDWASLSGSTQRVGLAHGTINVLATGVFGASWLARKAGHRFAGRALALAGFSAVSLGG